MSKGVKKAMRSYKNLRGKAVNRYSLDGRLIGTWCSGAAAARSLGIPVSRIYHCCGGKKPHTAGSVWRWASDLSGKVPLPTEHHHHDDLL